MRKKFICISLTGVIIAHTIALCLSVSFIPVYALSVGGLQTTIASVIMSLLLQTGTAPVNQSYIDAINTSYGVESSIGTVQDMITNGLLTESGGTLVDTGLSQAIESASAYTELGLDDLFSTTAADAGVIAASGGTNLAKTAINCGTVGTIGAFAGAAAIGVGLGVLVNKVSDYIKGFVKYGFPMSADTISDILNNIPDEYDSCCFAEMRYDNNPYRDSKFYYYDTDTVMTAYPSGTRQQYEFRVYSISESSVNGEYQLYRNATDDGTGNYTFENLVVPYGSITSRPLMHTRGILISTNAKVFDNSADEQAYINGLKAGTITPDSVKSPDIIGTLGNQYGENQVAPMIEQGEDMLPVSMQDYQDFADLANDNTDNGETGIEQADLLNNLIEPNIIKPSLIPDQNLPLPDVADRVPIPEQPNIPPKDPAETEDIENTLAGVTTPELTKVFPFCIPFDIYAMFSNLKYEVREAPVIEFEFPMDEYTGQESGYWKLEIDFSKYEQAAEILRKCELLLFIIGLAVATKNFLYGIG